MIDWLPALLAFAAGSVSSAFSRTAPTVVASFVVLGGVLWRNGGPTPVEPLAAALVTLAVMATVPSRVGRLALGVTLTGVLWPVGSDGISMCGPAIAAFGMTTALLAGGDGDARVPATRFATLAAAWVAALTLVALVQPAQAVINGGAVDLLAASRAKFPLAVAIACGLACWPLHTIILDACKRGSMAAPAVLPLLGLATLSRLNIDTALRSAVVGDVGSVFTLVGLFTLVIGGLLALAHEDLRFKIVASQIGLAGWTALIWFNDPAAARLLWATVAVASAVSGAVISRLEFRYRSRERNAFRGLAVRHPTAAVTLGFSGIVVAKAAVGPVGTLRALPMLTSIEPLLTVVALVAGLIYAAALADVLRELLFGQPRLPEYSGELFERVAKIGRGHGPLVGPTTLFAWGVPLLFVIVMSVAPYNVLASLGEATPSVPEDEPPAALPDSPTSSDVPPPRAPSKVEP